MRRKGQLPTVKGAVSLPAAGRFPQQAKGESVPRETALFFRRWGRPAGIVDLITEGHQSIREVDAFNHRFRMLHLDIVLGKVPESGHAAVDQAVGGLLGDLAGHAEHRHIDGVRGAESGNFVGVLNRETGNLLADEGGIFIEKSHQIEPGTCEIHMVDKGAAKVAHADQDRPKALIQPENLTDLLMEQRDVIAKALLSESAVNPA